MHGVAKGATLVIVKMTSGCTDTSAQSTWIMAWNWLAVNAPKGTIALKSSGVSLENVCGFGIVEPDVEAATLPTARRWPAHMMYMPP